VIAGILVVHSGDVLTTAREYGVTVMVLATLTLLGVIRPTRRQAPAPQTIRCAAALESHMSPKRTRGLRRHAEQ
jgi:hypothetical protein